MKSLFYFLCLGLCITSQPALARDLQGRMGIGYNSEFSNAYAGSSRVPGVSLKYGFSKDFAIAGILGVSTVTPSSTVTAVKFFQNFFFETNLNFYGMLGGGFVQANAVSGLEAMTGLGVEFFIPGIESVGFSFETGATVNNISGSYAIQTLGVGFLDAGIHFYF